MSKSVIIILGGIMAKVVKRKLKIKWKNFIIFIIIVIAILLLLIKGTTLLIDTIKTKLNEPPKTKEETKKKEKPKKQEKTELELKYEKLNNINKEIDYFREENIDRYIKYKEEHPELDIKKVIINVNIGLDLKPYDDAVPATNLNKINILVNKYNYLDKNYVPDNLEKVSSTYALNNMKLVNTAKDAYEQMAKDAAKSNMKLVIMSSYRSYDYQVDLYNRYAKKDGKDKADTYSGRPGFSEHQTGLAFDVYNGKVDYTKFETTKEFNWMQENAYKYGFILRFPKDKELETGYIYESWHYRYVGQDMAKEIKESNICLEEYMAMH